MADFLWTAERTQAAQLVAEGELTDGQIATAVGVVRQTIASWRRTPEFSERSEAISAEINAGLLKRAISHRERRVARQNDTWFRLQRLIAARAADPVMADVPGGSTGLMVARQKMLGSGDNAILVTEYEFDAAVAKELRDLEKQAATELGQWTEKHVVKNGDADTLRDVLELGQAGETSGGG